MAKLSIIARQSKRQEIVKKYAAKRANLKAIIKNPHSTHEARATAQDELYNLPRNSNKVRLRNRCALTGRPRGVYRKFGLSRGMIRIYAMRGDIPGLVKASW